MVNNFLFTLQENFFVEKRKKKILEKEQDFIVFHRLLRSGKSHTARNYTKKSCKAILAIIQEKKRRREKLKSLYYSYFCIVSFCVTKKKKGNKKKKRFNLIKKKKKT
jgi:hypothetical protein